MYVARKKSNLIYSVQSMQFSLYVIVNKRLQNVADDNMKHDSSKIHFNHF